MADLPVERCTDALPFTYCEVDMFGPYLIKERRSQLKRYGALFTCFSCRSIHIEITNASDTDSFILAPRRFMARRGAVRSIWSGNGTNFVETRNELQQGFKEMNHNKIKNFLRKKVADWIDWHHNPPAASHMGGVWERQIRAARNILEGLLRTHSLSLNGESFRTQVTEVELIVNSRPLTVETLNDTNSPTTMSPSNLLTLKSNVVMPPPGEFSHPDVYSRKRWRRVQHIAEEFWKRWRKEFLQNLQTRQKWQKQTPNFTVGDIVLLKDECQQNQRPMARILSIETDEKRVVRTVTLHVVDRNVPGRTQVLHRPITKIVMLVRNDEFDSPTEEPKRNAQDESHLGGA